MLHGLAESPPRGAGFSIRYLYKEMSWHLESQQDMCATHKQDIGGFTRVKIHRTSRDDYFPGCESFRIVAIAFLAGHELYARHYRTSGAPRRCPHKGIPRNSEDPTETAHDSQTSSLVVSLSTRRASCRNSNRPRPLFTAPLSVVANARLSRDKPRLRPSNVSYNFSWAGEGGRGGRDDDVVTVARKFPGQTFSVGVIRNFGKHGWRMARCRKATVKNERWKTRQTTWSIELQYYFVDVCYTLPRRGKRGDAISSEIYTSPSNSSEK